MNVVWDSDTGTVTFTASTSAGPVNLTATASRTLIAKHKASLTVTQPTITSSDLPNGIVTAAVASLAVGKYDMVLRVVGNDGVIVTYPSADTGAARFEVVANLDAV